MRRCKGWTLSSLLIALALASVLLLLFAKTFVFTLEASRQTVQIAQLHQSAQFVLGLMQRELRNGNFMAGIEHPQSLRALFSVDNDCRSANDSGSFPVDEQNFTLTRIGTVGDGATPECLSNAINQSDFLQLKRLAGEPTAKAELRLNRVYLAQSIAQTKWVTAATADLGNADQYWPYLHQVFYIARQAHQGRPVPVLMRKRLVRQQNGQLSMDTDSLLDGVEAMVFEAGIDQDHDGVADRFSSPLHGYTNTDNIVQIRFHILLRSVEPDPSYTNDQQYQLGARRFSAPGDHFRRLQLSSSVTFIN